jgi:cytochrome c553
MRMTNLSLVLVIVCLSPQARAVDLDNGEEINEVCAACHGEYGQGGKNGEYPRIAGQPAGYLFKQLKLFQDRSRPNMPMVEHVDKRELPDSDMEDISAYLSNIILPTKLPPVDETAPDFDAYQRLLQTKRLMQIARAEGDIEKGETLYNKECRSCHGRDGIGKPKNDIPMLAGQYTNYLWRQTEKYLDGTLIHDIDEPDSELLAEFTREEIRDIFAYLSVVDD